MFSRKFSFDIFMDFYNQSQRVLSVHSPSWNIWNSFFVKHRVNSSIILHLKIYRDKYTVYTLNPIKIKIEVSEKFLAFFCCYGLVFRFSRIFHPWYTYSRESLMPKLVGRIFTMAYMFIVYRNLNPVILKIPSK